MKTLLAFVSDVALVVVFTYALRLSHDQPVDPAAIADNTWPYLIGLAGGWLITRSWRRTLTLGSSLGVWFCTVLGGLGIRYALNPHVRLSSVIVTVFVLGFFLIGWRLIAFLMVHSKREQARQRTPD